MAAIYEKLKQNAYISVSFLGKEITTELYKVDTLINVEVENVAEAPNGFEITVVETTIETPNIDVPADLEQVLKQLE